MEKIRSNVQASLCIAFVDDDFAAIAAIINQCESWEIMTDGEIDAYREALVANDAEKLNALNLAFA